MRIDTWINGSLMTVDTGDVWLETFARWDALVPTDIAEDIATKTVNILKRHAENEQYSADRAHERVLGS